MSSDGFVRVDPDSTGKTIRTRTTPQGEQQVIVIADQDGNLDPVRHAIVDASALPAGAATETTIARRFGPGAIVGSKVVSASGDNVIYTPAAGKKVRLHWVGLSTSQNNPGEVLAVVQIGPTAGAPKVAYTWYLGNPGGFSHWDVVDGNAINDKLVVNLNAAGNNVAVNYSLEEI